MVGLNSLGRALHKVPGYSGPTVSRPEVSRRSSTFSVQENQLGPGMRPMSKRGSVYESMGNKSPNAGLRPGSETFVHRAITAEERAANAEANSALALAAAAEATNSSVIVKVRAGLCVEIGYSFTLMFSCRFIILKILTATWRPGFKSFRACRSLLLLRRSCRQILRVVWCFAVLPFEWVPAYPPFPPAKRCLIKWATWANFWSL